MVVVVVVVAVVADVVAVVVAVVAVVACIFFFWFHSNGFRFLQLRRSRGDGTPRSVPFRPVLCCRCWLLLPLSSSSSSSFFLQFSFPFVFFFSHRPSLIGSRFHYNSVEWSIHWPKGKHG